MDRLINDNRTGWISPTVVYVLQVVVDFRDSHKSNFAHLLRRVEI